MNWPLIIFGAGLLVTGVSFLLRIVIFDAIRELRESNQRQGKRLGELEQRWAAREAVEEYKRGRSLSRAHGIPVHPEDETPP